MAPTAVDLMLIFSCLLHMLPCAGGAYVPFCAWIQHVKLAVIGVGYTITAGIAMV